MANPFITMSQCPLCWGHGVTHHAPDTTPQGRRPPIYLCPICSGTGMVLNLLMGLDR